MRTPKCILWNENFKSLILEFFGAARRSKYTLGAAQLFSKGPVKKIYIPAKLVHSYNIKKSFKKLQKLLALQEAL
jgi:hypothetical protein